jgi:hypothetical protein
VEIELEIHGEVVERQELLDGTQSVTVEGSSIDGRYLVSLSYSWNRGLVDLVGEGDITISRSQEAEAFGSLISAAVRPGETVDWDCEVRFELDGGSGDWIDASGNANVVLELIGDNARGRVLLNLGTT